MSADSKMHGGTPPNASANLVSSRLLIYFAHVQLDVESGRSSAKQPADRECFFPVDMFFLAGLKNQCCMFFGSEK